jgi:chromate transport protein ChrA
MGVIKLLARAVRRIIRFPLVQLLIVIILILILQAADDTSVLGRIFTGLDKAVESTVDLFSGVFTVKSFTRSWLTFSLMICYVYLACLFILYILRIITAGLVLLIARTNAFGLRSSIARERGIAAYRAWLPFERIRPANISQKEWEETFAWPPDDKPPYPSLQRRILSEIGSYIVLVFLVVVLLQIFTPFPAIRWVTELVQYLLHIIRSR